MLLNSIGDLDAKADVVKLVSSLRAEGYHPSLVAAVLTQAKLLRALENRRFKRVGGVSEIQLDAAVIAGSALHILGWRQDLDPIHTEAATIIANAETPKLSGAASAPDNFDALRT